MSLIVIGQDGADDLHPSEGWGDVPEADRPLWSRYMVDHCPWFPGVTVMLHLVPGVMNGGTRAPKIWKDHAQALHAAGFTPAKWYLLAELITGAKSQLDVHRHAPLFDLWPDPERRTSAFRINPVRWVPWLDQVRAGESPRRAHEWVLTDGDPEPFAGWVDPATGRIRPVG